MFFLHLFCIMFSLFQTPDSLDGFLTFCFYWRKATVGVRFVRAALRVLLYRYAAYSGHNLQNMTKGW